MEKEARLYVHKSWFIMPEGVLALGSNISLMLNASVSTTLDQALLRGSVHVGLVGEKSSILPEGAHVLKGLDYISHANMTYVLDVASTQTVPSFRVRNTIVNGSWSSINSAASSALLALKTLTIEADHGNAPKNASYAYAVLPNTPLTSVDAVLRNFRQGVRVVSQNDAVHAVLYSLGGNDVLVASAFGTGLVKGGPGWTANVRTGSSVWILSWNGPSSKC